MEDKQSLRCCYMFGVPDQVTGRKKLRTEPELETVAVEPDVRASGTCAESNWLTGTCRLEVIGGTDMVDGRPRQIKAYNVSV